MFGATTPLARAATALLLGALLALGAPLAPAARAAAGYVNEGEAAFAGQLAAKEVSSVTVNKRLRTLRVTLKDGSLFLARYPKKQSAQTIARLEAKGVRVTVLSQGEAEAEAKSKKSHHKIRYIAGGVLIAAIAIAAGVLLYRRRAGRD